jgi:uncharacterized membrane protein
MSLKTFRVSQLAARFSLRKALAFGVTLLLFTSLLGTLIPIGAAAGSLWTRSNFVLAKAGDTVSFDISLAVYSGVLMDGWSGDTYTLAAAGLPDGWTARFYFGNIEITSINVKQGETLTIKMDIITSTTTPPGDYNITFLADSNLTGCLSLPLTVTIRPPERHIKINSAYPYLAKRSGEVLSYPITITNDGEKDELLILNAALPSGWTAYFRTTDGKFISGLYLEPNHSQQFIVEFNPPKIIEAGTYNFTIIATSEDGCVNATLNLQADVYGLSIELKSSMPQLSGLAGNAFSYPITLINYGADALFRLSSTELPAGWRVTFKLGNKEVQNVYLEAGSSSSLTVELTPPSTASEGEYQIIICASSVDGSISTDVKLWATIVSPERKISITPAYPCVQLEQGRSLSCPLTIKNEGTCDERLNLSVITPLGWQGAFKATSGMGESKLNTIYLAAGSAISLVFEATPTQNYELGEHLFILRAASVDGLVQASCSLKINVVPRTQFVLSCQLPMKVVQPGETAKFQVSLTNPTSTGQAFSISVNSLPGGWNAKIKTSQGENIHVINANAGETATLTVEVSTPTNVKNDTYPIVLTAKSEWMLENLTLWVTVQSPSAKIELKAVPPYLDTYGGSEVKFKIQVSNTGGLDELLNLTSEGLPSDFRVVFKDSAGQQITAIYVEAGQSKEFYVTVSAPQGQLGARSFTVSTFNAELREKVDLTLNILGFYKVELTNQNFYTSTNVGGEALYTLYVKNAGNMEVGNVKVSATGSIPDGFTISISPDSIQSLGINREASFTIAIQTESDVNAGNYYVNFQVTSDQTESLPFTLRVEVFQTTNWILYAGIIFVIAVIALILIYRKFGRR